MGGVTAPTSPAPGHVLGREAGLRGIHPQHPVSAEPASRPRRPEGETLEGGPRGNCRPQAQPALPQLTVGDSGKGTVSCSADRNSVRPPLNREKEELWGKFPGHSQDFRTPSRSYSPQSGNF